MKIHCHRPSLAAAFQVVGGVIPSRTPKDILKNVKLEVQGGDAVLIGTDQEVGIRYKIPGVEIESAGETLLPTNRVTSILRELPDDTVNLEVDDEGVWVRAERSEFRLASQDPVEFPAVAAFEDERYHIIPAVSFKEGVRRTQFATDVESTRYALGGVLVELGAEEAHLAATDSRRLAIVRLPCRSQGVEDDAERMHPVVPSKAMQLIERCLGDGEEELLIAVHANDVLVKTENSTIYSRLVEGRFPNYRDVVPKEVHSKIELLVGPFYSAVRQAQIVTDEESRGVDFEFNEGVLRLNSRASNVGQSKVEMPISYEGEAITITFDPRYVAEFLRVLEPETQIRLELIDSESAAVFRTDDAYTYVVMPLSRER